MAGFHHFRQIVGENLLEFSRHEVSLSRDKEGQVDVEKLSLALMPGRLRETIDFTDILLPSVLEKIEEIWQLNLETTRAVEDILLISASRYADETNKVQTASLTELGNEVGNMILRLPTTNIAVNETDQIDRLSDFPVVEARTKREDFRKRFIDAYGVDAGLLILYTLSTIRQDAMEIVLNDTKHPR